MKLRYDFYVLYECAKLALIKWLLLKRRHNVYPCSLKQTQMFRLIKGTGLSMEKIYHYVLQFVDGTRNLWRQGQC